MIRGQDHLRLGEEATLTCEVSDLYPAELLTVDWLRGDTVLQTSVGHSGSGPGSSSIQTRYVFTPNTEDTGENVTCRATLDLRGLAAEDRTRETTVPLSPRCTSSLCVSLNPLKKDTFSFRKLFDVNPAIRCARNLEGSESILSSDHKSFRGDGW